ncbi:MAG: hypothetical protein ABJ242_05105 [Marinomonas sp.]
MAAIFAITAFLAASLTPLIAFRAGFVLKRLIIGDYALIVIRELQVIFGLNSVTMMLRILCQLLIFIKQLRRISARTAINPVHLIAAAILIAIVVTTTAATIIIAIIIQWRVLPHPSFTRSPLKQLSRSRAHIYPQSQAAIQSLNI